MLVPRYRVDEGMLGTTMIPNPAELKHHHQQQQQQQQYHLHQQQHHQQQIDEEFRGGGSVQAWQCFPEGSLSSIESFPPNDDDEFGGSPATAMNGGQMNRLEEPSTLRVKLMCSFGGRILPRPSDGKLRYVGGETRIVSVRRDVTYPELMQKMREHYGQDLSLKYQLPNEDLDALISVSTEEDLQNMMEEYDRLEGGDGLQRLRVFLFSTLEGDIPIDPLDPKKSEQWYVEAVNGYLETGSRSGGISARPSAENLLALDTLDQEQAALLLSKKMQELHAFNSATSSPSLVSQQPHPRHLGNSYAMFGSEGQQQQQQQQQQQHFGIFNADFSGHSDLDHYYGNLRPEVLPPSHDLDRMVRGYGAESKIPRVGSHGKLSRLQDQHDDGPQDLLTHEPRPRFVLQQHALPVRQHPLDASQEYRRQDYAISDGSFHILSHQQPSAQPMVYHKEPVYRTGGDQFPQHHRHQIPDDGAAYPTHEYIQQHHLQLPEDYYPAHIYQRSSSHVDGGGISGHAAATYQIGSSPSSPRVAYRDGRHAGLHQQPLASAHRAYAGNPVEHQYVRRPHEESTRQQYRLSSSPPRYRDHHHHIEEQRPFIPLNQDRYSADHLAAATIIPSMPGMPLYGPGFQENSAYPENIQRSGRQTQTSPLLSSRLDYPDQMMQMEHLSLHQRPEKEEDQRQKLVNECDGGIPLLDDSITRTRTSNCTTTGKCLPMDIYHDQQQELTDPPIFDKSGDGRPVFGITGAGFSTLPPDTEAEAASTSACPSTNPYDAAGGLIETRYLAEDMASSVLKSNVMEQEPSNVSQPPGNLSLHRNEQNDLDLAPQATFTAQNWDNAFAGGGGGEDDAAKQEDSDQGGGESHEKVVDDSLEDPPLDALAAEKEAIRRGLQMIRNSDLEEIRELGSGTYGTVYHGKWRGTDVAIKRIKASCFAGKPSERDRLVADFWKEACTLSQLHHPNVVAFYGVVPDGPGGTLATVTEYMVNGSLKQVLQKKDRTIDRRKRLLIATDAAFGMEYLHAKNIVHFDLKCENLLVNMKDPHRPVCKVGDLGLSKVKRQTMVSGGVRGTLPWMAPELLNPSSSMVSERVDVFSFGIVMWELLTGEEPYANMHYGAIIGGIVNNTLRPPIPNWCDPGWRSLMERCWAADPATRPSFSEIAKELRTMTSSLQQQKVW